MKNKKILTLLLINVSLFLPSCKQKKNFIKVDNSYTAILNENSHLNDGRKIVNTTIKDYDGFNKDKEEITNLVNDIIDCKYKDNNKLTGIDGGDYYTYSVTFLITDTKKFDFSFDTLNRTYIKDYQTSTSLSFDNSVYKYDCLNNLRDKVMNIFKTVDSKNKEIVIKTV